MKIDVKDHFKVGVRVKCLFREIYIDRLHPDVFDKIGIIYQVYGDDMYVEWDDASLNNTVRRSGGWNMTAGSFELLECPENQQSLAEIEFLKKYGDGIKQKL